MDPLTAYNEDYIAAVEGEDNNRCQMIPDVTGPILNGQLPETLLCRAGLPESPDTLAVWDAPIPSTVFRNSPKVNHYFFLNQLAKDREPPQQPPRPKLTPPSSRGVSRIHPTSSG